MAGARGGFSTQARSPANLSPGLRVLGGGPPPRSALCLPQPSPPRVLLVGPGCPLHRPCRRGSTLHVCVLTGDKNSATWVPGNARFADGDTEAQRGDMKCSSTRVG